MYSNGFSPPAKMATIPILGICVFGSYDYPGSSGECYRTIMVHLLEKYNLLRLLQTGSQEAKDYLHQCLCTS